MRWGLGFVILTCVGCGTILGADFDEANNGPGGPVDSDAADEASTAGDAGDAEAGNPSADCEVLYVSPTGDDTNLGCVSAHPKQTIGSALETARISPKVTSIHVCAGTFDEQLLLDVSVDLLGGWSCTTWERSASYGSPNFDDTNRTKVGETVVPKALHSAHVDGLTIQGPSGENLQDGVALEIDGAANLTVSNCQIVGGDTFSVKGDGSVGLRIENGASPEIHSNFIDGGSGRALGPDAKVGRAAIVVDSASPYIHGNEIHGGKTEPTQSEGFASVGVIVRGTSSMTEAKTNPLLGNGIYGGDGWGPLGGIASMGVLVVDSSDVDFIESQIRPGSCVGDQSPTLNAAVQLRGIQFESTGALRILRSRIYGGDLANPLNPSEGFRVGVWVDGASSFLAENDMIYGGVALAEAEGPGASPSFGIALGHTSNAIIRHSTIYSGPSAYPTVGTPLKINNGVTNAIVQNNILAADAGWNEPMYVEKCASAGVFSDLRNNLLFDTNINFKPGDPGVVFGYGPTPGGACGGWQGITSVDELETHMATACTATTPTACKTFGGTKVAGNLTMKATCAGDTRCIQWPACDVGTSLECLHSIFQSWSASDNGFTELFDIGWRLSSKVPCSVAKSSLLLPDVGVDLFGKERTTPTSMGAHEMDGLCDQ